jgi:hypothetical protein
MASVKINNIKQELTALDCVKTILIDASDRVWLHNILKEDRNSERAVENIKDCKHHIFIDSSYKITGGFLDSKETHVIKGYTS